MIIKDICEVTAREINDPTKVYFLGVNTKNDINQKVKQEILKGKQNCPLI